VTVHAKTTPTRRGVCLQKIKIEKILKYNAKNDPERYGHWTAYYMLVKTQYLIVTDKPRIEFLTHIKNEVSLERGFTTVVGREK
jgi:hypothetical protein